MDYNLDSLGSRNFEHMTQAMLIKVIGPKLVVFGDGPDGGREATWRGESASLGNGSQWNGYGVLQAKYKLQTEDPSRNLVWLKSTIRSELKEWVNSDSKRTEKPDYMVFVTNVRLSSVPDHGKDEINAFVKNTLKELNLKVKEFRVWDYYEVVAQLDGDSSIRNRYAAFITPGDLIAALLDEASGFEKTFGQAIEAYTARCLRDESFLTLTQAGTAGDGQVTIADVFIDLPSELPSQTWLVENLERADDLSADEPESVGAAFDSEGRFEIHDSRSGIAAHLTNDFNYIPEARREGSRDPHRTVLVGGPGQGKSTVTQWLAEVYRAEFLRGSGSFGTADVASAAERIDARRIQLEMPRVNARRWPVRIVLTELADYLAKNPDRSLLHYMAMKISDRSSFEVDPLMLRKWLSSYPWLLLIDGLDEVPVTSNRRQVMTSIKDFFIDVAAIGGDVATVATTRPQGYSEEFSPEEYRHFQLSSLAVDEALSYAEGLVAVRMGRGTSTATKVMDRLRRASEEEHTRTLFESPLQVTILEVLLEKLGKAPSDRSRLYSAYYSVISQREQEKSGALSDLLQRFESDVDYLHRRIGFELQQRGSEVGETSSSLSIEEFEAFIVERFRDQGHSEIEVASLSGDFGALVTDRLVFLAKLQADRIGFELRSLQEFMSGEYIVHLPEARVIDEIERFASVPYWRNVVLFAIGSIFAHKEHLRAEIVLLCDRMNIERPAAALILPGADLALDILRDGSCLSMPKYSQRLARIALAQIESPHETGAQVLLYFNRQEFADLLWIELESLSPASASHWMNRATLLSHLQSADGDRANVALRKLFAVVNREVKVHLIQSAWDTRNWNLGAVVGDEFVLCSPQALFAHRSPFRKRRIPRKDDGSAPRWMANLMVVSGEMEQGDQQYRGPDLAREPFVANYQQLGQHHDAWEWLSVLETNDADWVALKSVAAFALDPTAESLAKSLGQLSSTKSTEVPNATPWPLIACIRDSGSRVGSANVGSMWSILGSLQHEARSGALGDGPVWQAAQDRWGQGIPVTADFIEHCVQRVGLPLWPEIAKDGYLPWAYTYTAYGIDEKPARLEIAGLIFEMEKHFSEDPIWPHLANFLATILAQEDEDELPARAKEIFELIERSVVQTDARTHWTAWLGLMPASRDRPSAEVLRRLAAQETLIGELGEEHANVLFSRIDQDGVSALCIALLSKPRLLEDISVERLDELAAGDSSAKIGALRPIRRILHAGPEAIWSGAIDDSYREIVSSSASSFGEQWFVELLNIRGGLHTVEVAARGAQVLADSHPSVAQHLTRIARSLAKANSVVGQPR
jgi:hypothetical protein